MNSTLSSASGWRLAVAAGALAALTVGCGTDLQPPPGDIGNQAPVPPVIAEAEVPAYDTQKCAEWPSEARAEKRTLCR